MQVLPSISVSPLELTSQHFSRISMIYPRQHILQHSNTDYRVAYALAGGRVVIECRWSASNGASDGPYRIYPRHWWRPSYLRKSTFSRLGRVDCSIYCATEKLQICSASIETALRVSG